MKTLWNDGWVFLKTQPEENFTDVQQKAEEFQPVDVPHDWLIYDATKLYEDGCETLNELTKDFTIV